MAEHASTPRPEDLLDPSKTLPLPSRFFERSPSAVAPELLGCVVVSSAGGVPTGGRIVETEAYLGAGDPGSHASTKGITPRNSVMYGPPGVAYVYFTYGNHFMLNAVCEAEGIAGAVLIRALEPLLGVSEMTLRRHGRPVGELCNGPGKLCAALGIDARDNGVPFGDGRLGICRQEPRSSHDVAVSGRIGLTQGHDLPLRFFVPDDPSVSRAQTGPRSVNRRSGGNARTSGRQV